MSMVMADNNRFSYRNVFASKFLILVSHSTDTKKPMH